MRSLSIVLLFLAPTVASAQVPFRAPIVGRSRANVSASAHRTVADAAADGGTLAAIHFDSDLRLGRVTVRSLDAGQTVALVRFGPRGDVRWVRRFAEEAGRGQPHLRVIERVVALPDGGAVVGGSWGDGGLDQGALMRVDRRGRTLWRLSPSLETDYSRFVPAPTGRGSVVLLGSFFRGRFQLPGAPAWTSRQRFTSFVAEVGLDGQVRWARRLAGHARHVAVSPRGEILVAGTFRRALRHGSSRLRGVGGDDVFVARLDAGGEPLDAVAVSGRGDLTARGLAGLPDGSFAVLSSSGPGSLERYTLTGFDPEAERSFAQLLGRRAALARDGGRYLAVVAGPARAASIRGTPYDVSDRFTVRALSATGAAQGERSFGIGAWAVLRSLRVNAAGGRVVLGGASTDGRGGSESFHVWAAAPAARAPARFGSVL